jgi:hypothetical protein
MDQQYRDLGLVDTEPCVVDGNEDLSVFNAVRLTRMVESQCRAVTVNAGLAVDRFSRIHVRIIVAQRASSEAHSIGATRD